MRLGPAYTLASVGTGVLAPIGVWPMAPMAITLVLLGILLGAPEAYAVRWVTRSLALDRVIEKTKRDMGITSVEVGERKITFFQEGFDRIARAQLWLHPIGDHHYALLKDYGGDRSVMTFGVGDASTAYEVVPTDLPSALLLKSSAPQDPAYPYRLVDASDPFVQRAEYLSPPVPVAEDNVLVFKTEKGGLLLAKDNPMAEVPLFKGDLDERDETAYLLKHEQDKYSVVLKENVNVRSELMDLPPKAYDHGWIGQVQYMHVMLRRNDLQEIRRFVHFFGEGDNFWAVRDDETLQFVSKEDWLKSSPQLSYPRNSAGHPAADLWNLPKYGVSWILPTKNGNQRLLLRSNPLIYSPEFFEIFGDRGSCALVTAQDRANELRSWTHSDWNFLIHRENPSKISPAFIGEPQVFENSFLVRLKRSWAFLRQDDPSVQSIEISPHGRIENVDDAWAISDRPEHIRLIQKKDITVHTGIFRAFVNHGMNWEATDERGWHHLVKKTDLRRQSRGFFKGFVDYGQSVAVRVPGLGDGAEGHWRLLLNTDPTVESIAFRRILKGKRTGLSKLVKTPIPTQLLVEDMNGQPVWLSTATVQPLSDVASAN